MVNTGPGYVEVDHIIPVSKGGSNSAENAQLVHKFCNMHKGNSFAAQPLLRIVDIWSPFRVRDLEVWHLWVALAWLPPRLAVAWLVMATVT
jgi:hypothetical protein